MKWLIILLKTEKYSAPKEYTYGNPYRRLDFLVSSVAKENIKRCPVIGIAALLSTSHFYIVHF